MLTSISANKFRPLIEISLDFDWVFCTLPVRTQKLSCEDALEHRLHDHWIPNSEEVAMQKSRQAMRRVVLRALFEHLEETYNLEFPHEASFRNNLARHQIDALIAFKSDERLDALRGALDRLESGTFGSCLCCKKSIEEELLDQDTSRPMCAVCEGKFRTVEHIRQPWMPTYIQ